MRDLKRAGFLTISLDSWNDFSRPNRNRTVLTFDDGSRTVFRKALPVLARHLFTATQFLVADAIGGTNHWDIRNHGEAPDALMDTAEVRDWISAGQEIGSHTLTHPVLTAIQAAQAKEEIFASNQRRSWKISSESESATSATLMANGRAACAISSKKLATQRQSPSTLASTPKFAIHSPCGGLAPSIPPAAFATLPRSSLQGSRFGSFGSAN